MIERGAPEAWSGRGTRPGPAGGGDAERGATSAGTPEGRGRTSHEEWAQGQQRDGDPREQVVDDVPQDALGSPGGVTRRQALQLGAAAAGLLALDLDQTAAAADTGSRPAAASARERSFDGGWRFFRGDATGAEVPTFDDGSWRMLDLPHDWSIEDLPYAPPPDGSVTSDPSLLVLQTPPPTPVPPPVIGPFDPQNSANGGSTAYTVGGIASSSDCPNTTEPSRMWSSGSTASTRTPTSGSTARTWASTPTATRRSRST
jgi:hypothetical protein